MHKFKLILFLLLFTCTFSPSILAADHLAPIDTSVINARIDSLFLKWDQPDSPGAMVSVVQNGTCIYQKGFGTACLEHNIPVNSKSVFDIASISKQFTGFAIATLIHQGKISLDDDIRKYLPEMNEFEHKITIRHLVYHTSGIRDIGAMLLAGIRLDDVMTFDKLLVMPFNQQDLNIVPGSDMLYSNTGYNLLAEIVQIVTDMSFREWTHENIFEPLEMTNSHFRDNHTEIIEHRAYGYFLNGENEYQADPNNQAGLGASSLYTTAEDLQKWVQNFSKPVIGGDAVLKIMLQKGELNNGVETSYAFGLNVVDYRGIERIGHDGQWASFNSSSQYYRAHDLSIVVLGNTALAPWNLVDQICDLYLNDYYVKEKKAAHSFVNVKNKVLKKYEGDYWNEERCMVRKVYLKDNNLIYSRSRGNETPLAAINENEFLMRGINPKVTVEFETNDRKKVMKVLSGGRQPAWFEKFETINYLPEQLDQFTGTFYSEELETTYKFTVENDKLVAKHFWGNKVEFSSIKKDMFRGNQRYFQSVKFVRNAEGEIIGLKVGNFRNRNIWFKKL